MNAATQRKLTPVLVIVAVVFGVLLLVLLAGVGQGVHWDAPRETAPLSVARSVTLPPAPPLASYASVWEHPLFTSDRKPMVSTASGGVSLGDLELTGIIITPQLHMALLRDKSDKDKEVRVRQGEALPDGSWTLVDLQPRSAIFASSSGRTELKLPAGAPIDPLSTNAPDSTQQQPGAATMQRVNPGQPPGQPSFQRNQPPPPPPPPSGEQLQRILKLKAAILKQRAQPSGADAGVH
jgi:general secretion pathway protein N